MKEIIKCEICGHGKFEGFECRKCNPPINTDILIHKKLKPENPCKYCGIPTYKNANAKGNTCFDCKVKRNVEYSRKRFKNML